MINLLADFTVRFNSSLKRNVASFFIPFSTLNIRITELLLKHNCISSFRIDTCGATQKLRIRVTPLYVSSEPLIRRVELVSSPGRRVY